MKKSTKYFWLGTIGIFGGAFFTAGAGDAGYESMAEIGALVFIVSIFVLLPMGFHHRSKEKKAAYDALPPEEQARVDAETEQKVAAAQARWEEVRAANTIVSTAIVDTTMKSKTKASVTSSVVRGAVGFAIHPVAGAVGALTPKKTTITKAKTVTFSIRYANGECKLETVKVGSKRFKELAKYIA